MAWWNNNLKMKKIILLLLLLPLIGLAQQNNTTNTNFTNGLASSKFFNIPRGTVPPTTGILAGSLFFHTVDGLQYYDGSVWKTVAATGLGVTSFNGRTGAVTPQSGDYSSFYVPLARTLSTSYGLTGGGDLSANRTLVADTTSANGLVSKSRLATNLGGYVPYINATGDVNLGTHSLKAESITLDSVPATIPTSQGSMYFSDAYQTLAVVLNGTVQRVGEDVFFQVKNQTGVTIPKGTAVRYDGVVSGSGRIKVVPFLADGSHPSIYFVGVTSEDIANGADGKAYFFGSIRGINTNAYPVGTILYASTTVAGGFQSTAPVAPNNIISVAAVTNQGTSNGEIVVRPLIGSNINNDEGVKITNPIAGDLLQYKASGLWENEPLDSTGLVTIATNQTITGAKSFNTDITTRNGSGLIFYNNGNTSSTSLYANGGLDNEFFTILLPAANGTVALTSNLSSYVPTSRTITAGLGLSGGGDLSTNRTISADTTVLRTTANSLTLAQTQSALNLKENLANKATDFSTVNNTLYPTVQAVKTYADGLVVGLLNDRGSYDPTATSAYPTTGGSGAGGAIKKGDIWYISANGTIGGVTVLNGYSVRALADSPAQVAANWNILQVGLGYVPENVANKATDLTSPDNTKYPTTLAVSTALSTKQPTLSGTGLVKSTAGTISYITDNSTDWNTAYSYSQIGHLPLSGGTLTGPLNGTNATFSGNIRSSYNSVSAQTIDLVNSFGAGSYALMGIEGGTAGTTFSGTTAYGVLYGTTFNKPIHFGTNGTVRYTIDASGNNTWTGNGTFAGVLNTYNTLQIGGWNSLEYISTRLKIGGVTSGQWGEVGLYTNGVQRVNLSNTTLTVDAALTGTSATFSGAGIFKGAVSGGSGSGTEIQNVGGLGFFQSYNRTSNTFEPVYLRGSTITFESGTAGGIKYEMDASGNNTWTGRGTFGGQIYAPSAVFENNADGSAWANASLQIKGTTNPGITFYIPGTYAASLFLNTSGTLSWGGNLYAGANLSVGNLAGSGDRFVVTNSSGTLITATIGSGLSYSGGVLSATGGSSGTVTGTGTAGYIPKWNSASDIGNSVLSESSGNIYNSGWHYLTASDSRIIGGDATGRLITGNSGTTTYSVYYGASHATVPNTFVVVTNNATALTINSSQAATFSSSVTASSFSGAGTGLTGTASGLSIGGNAATASNSTLWQSWDLNYSAEGTTLAYLFGGDGSAATQRYYTSTKVKAFLGIDAGTTFANNITGNAGTATFATQWNGYTFDNSTVYSSGFDYIFGRTTSTGQARLVTAGGLQSFLGLGSNAYTSTTYAPLNSPGFTGTPTAPTPSAGDNSNKLATTAYFDAAIGKVLLRSTTTFSGSGLGSSQDYNTGIQSGSILLVIPGSSDAAGAGYYVAKNPGCGGLCDEWHIIFPNGAPIGTSNITFYYVVLQ